MNLGLRDRRALVPAATTGLGFATARRLLAEGARVHICGSDPGRLDAAVRELGPRCSGSVTDLAAPGSGTALAESATAGMGGIDILVANAPGPGASHAIDLSQDAVDQAMRLNFMSAVELCTATVPGMRRRGWGRVVAITSLAVREPFVGLTGSGAARAALTVYLKSLNDEVREDGVTVNSIQPGSHETARYLAFAGTAVDRDGPGRRVGSPDHFGALVAFLCSELAGYVSGAGLPVAGGYQHAW
ncbi:SDR family oxidoreductase [Actinomadura sp. KC345]|uniref:SDR family NAD(P)-dependent oxidoreductase n=1 Tax=Actinomadura sp. KC345 TaxID=2530371 RepID=UPI001051E1AB|nr:SDR family NAD(P)-dependent oxidoreductase [Actinomadura sp. KC345]TDC55479.1 SDR family oxidoreductase [Actinomadura sp. KC345]